MVGLILFTKNLLRPYIYLCAGHVLTLNQDSSFAVHSFVTIVSMCMLTPTDIILPVSVNYIINDFLFFSAHLHIRIVSLF